MEFPEKEYKVTIDVKSILITICYIWLIVLSVYIFRGELLEVKDDFITNTIIPTLQEGQKQFDKFDKNNTKETNASK